MPQTILVPQLYVPTPQEYPPNITDKKTKRSEDWLRLLDLYGPSRRDLIMLIADELVQEVNECIVERWKSKQKFAEHIAPLFGMTVSSACYYFFQDRFARKAPSLRYLLAPSPFGWYKLNPMERTNIVFQELLFEDCSGRIAVINELRSGVPVYWKKKGL